MEEKLEAPSGMQDSQDDGIENKEVDISNVGGLVHHHGLTEGDDNWRARSNARPVRVTRNENL